MTIPNDSVMLLSYVNTQLSDFYPSLYEMCKALDIDEEEIREKLKSIDYEYNSEINKFV